MRFCVFSDLHYDAVPDGARRIQELLRDCREKQVDLLVELGDLCHPIEKNRKILEQLRGLDIPCIFLLGNHDVETYGRTVAADFLGLERGYYSVNIGVVKFVVLDVHQETKTGMDAGPWLPLEQLSWLEQEIEDDRYFYVICTHQSLINDFVTADGKVRGITNREAIRNVLERRNRRSRRVLLCLNGHDHGTLVQQIGGITYYGLNSASYYWQGVREMFPYERAVHEAYPYLKNMVLYREALHSIVSIAQDGSVSVTGMEGHYQTIGPQEIGMGTSWNGVSILPRTESLVIPAQSL